MGLSQEELAHHLRRLFLENTGFIYLVMQLVGLTRNKILTDLRAVLAASGGRAPSDARLLPSRAAAWQMAGPYLAKRVRTTFTPLLAHTEEELAGAFEAISQATWPGWIRQERAKRQGHEAEGRLAVLLQTLNFPFEPTEKAMNPLCADATVNGVSFDLVAPSVNDPALCVKATVHTANIGQYGESKDALEVSEARAALGGRFDSPIVLALIDGVGFESNRAGLNGVLSQAQEFCQFRTLWKGGVLGAWACGLRVALILPDTEQHDGFLARYASSIEIVESARERTGWTEAGEAMIRAIPM